MWTKDLQYVLVSLSFTLKGETSKSCVSEVWSLNHKDATSLCSVPCRYLVLLQNEGKWKQEATAGFHSSKSGVCFL